MDKISSIVINSKAAENHLNDVKLQHATMLQGIQNQSARIAEFNAQKRAQSQMDSEKAQKTQFEIEKAKMEAETKHLDAENKAKELAIKEQALSM